MAFLPAVQVANTFITRFGENGKIDHLKLQKLSYFAYGWGLALRDRDRALMNVRPQVWKLGPVFQPIYSSFVGARFDFITEVKKVGPFQEAEVIAKSNAPESEIIDWIWQKYGSFSGTVLSDMTHKPDTPWYKIAQRHNFVVPKFLEMDDDENRPYFVDLARKEGIAVQ